MIAGRTLLDRFGRPIDVSEDVMQARVAWAGALLTALPGPLSVNNAGSFTSWETAEGGSFGNVAENNPLNCTIPLPGSSGVVYTGYGDVYVQAYVSEAQGIEATVTTLTNGDYPAILADVAASAALTSTCTAIGESPWGTVLDVLLECIPEAEAAVAQYWQPQGADMEPFIKERNGNVYWFIPAGKASYWRGVPTALVGSISSSNVIDDSTGGWLAMWAHNGIVEADGTVTMPNRA